MTKKIDGPQATHHEEHADIVSVRLQEGVEVRQRARVEGLSRFRGLLRQHRLARRRRSLESMAARTCRLGTAERNTLEDNEPRMI